MNHVNLIGKVGAAPTIATRENGKKVARFYLSTNEHYCDSDGKTKTRSNNHRITAWGRWIPIIEEYGLEGSRLAIEGRLINRFYHSNGKSTCITEVEVNDLIIM